MKFYQIENPKTEEIFNAIIKGHYVPLEKIKPKSKQIHVLLKNYFCSDNIYITFDSVTNTGGYPIFFNGNDFDFLDFINTEGMDKADIDNEIELLNTYSRSFEQIFNN